jgi:hypothetical protein
VVRSAKQQHRQLMDRRDALIRKLAKQGVERRLIAILAGLTQARICQIAGSHGSTARPPGVGKMHRRVLVKAGKAAARSPLLD